MALLHRGSQGIAQPLAIGVSDAQMRRDAQGFSTHGRETVDRGQCPTRHHARTLALLPPAVLDGLDDSLAAHPV